jgi:hypothetical protein
MDARFNCVSLTKKTVSNEQRSMNPPGLPWFHLGRRRRPCSSMGSFLRRTDDCRRLSTLETSDLSSAETCLASFFRVAEFHVLSERLVNWTLFFSLSHPSIPPIFPSSTYLMPSYLFHPPLPCQLLSHYSTLSHLSSTLFLQTWRSTLQFSSGPPSKPAPRS